MLCSWQLVNQPRGDRSFSSRFWKYHWLPLSCGDAEQVGLCWYFANGHFKWHLLINKCHTRFISGAFSHHSFPHGSDSKESTCNVGGLGSIPGLERSSREGMATYSSILARLGFPGALPQRRVVWMWFGAFPGAFGLGRAQPQRRGTSP